MVCSKASEKWTFYLNFWIRVPFRNAFERIFVMANWRISVNEPPIHIHTAYTMTYGTITIHRKPYSHTYERTHSHCAGLFIEKNMYKHCLAQVFGCWRFPLVLRNCIQPSSHHQNNWDLFFCVSELDFCSIFAKSL